MKTLDLMRQARVTVLSLAALTGLVSTANAVTFTWLDGPLAGQPFAGGPIEIKAFNHDTGTLYNQQPTGTVLTGAALDAQVSRPALNGMGSDSWGILKITEVYSKIGSQQYAIYSHLSNNYELTGMFWGIQDTYLNQVSAGSGLPGGGQVIDGTGMMVHIYSDPSKNFSSDPNGGLNGPSDRTGISTFPTVTDGQLELILQSTNGFINAAGTFGGVATEFESNTAAVGYAALNVLGGASAAQFNTNAVGFKGSYGADFLPGVGTQTSTDIWFAFTSIQGEAGWDIKSNDPMIAVLSGPSVPDSGSTLIMLTGGLFALLAAARTRRGKTL
jgi:hypothetical protein